jgi:hypothetical protein
MKKNRNLARKCAPRSCKQSPLVVVSGSIWTVATDGVFISFCESSDGMLSNGTPSRVALLAILFKIDEKKQRNIESNESIKIYLFFSYSSYFAIARLIINA